MNSSKQTQVAIIGAGPAGLLLSHLLDLRGIESVVLESRSRQAVESTVRAGVLEQGTVDLLVACGLGERLLREGFVHQGINLRFDGRTHRIDLHELTAGRSITIYPQHEVLRDMVAAAVAAGRQVIFEAQDVQIHDFDTEQPRVTFRHDGQERWLRCDFIAGCDGCHGVARPSIPAGAIRTYGCQLPIGWLGILIAARPSSAELIYAHHECGFALVSTRSPQVQRLYLQCDPGDDLASWPEERIWRELKTRLATRDGWELICGEILQKNIVCMRSLVTEPMHYGRVFLAGDAAHVVPPTGAKGLNLAVADVSVLAPALAEYYETGRSDLMHDYSSVCLPRVWRAQRFSAWMTAVLHRLPGTEDYQSHIQLAELDYLVHSPAAAASLAENYVGFPLPAAAVDGLCGSSAQRKSSQAYST
jgi:p-hydroxybenzoate 3-monooxygenase